MQFSVPQFIDVEDKIIGPFTLKQFGFIFGGGLILVGLFRFIGLSPIFFILGLPIAIATLFAAFGSFNGKRVYDAFPIFLRFVNSPKRMIFHHEKIDINDIDIEAITAKASAEQIAAQAPIVAEEPVANRLRKLSLALDQKYQEESEAVTGYKGQSNGR